MKKLTKYYTLRDERGRGVVGKTIVAYPIGTTLHGTIATDDGYGKYTFIIDPTSDNLVISRFYDLYVNGIIYQSGVDLGLFNWYVSDTNVDAVESFNFADLIDENGEELPITLNNIQISLVAKNNRQAKVVWTTTNLTITLDSSGDDNIGCYDLKIEVIK